MKTAVVVVLCLVVAGAAVVVTWERFRLRHENDQDMINVLVAKGDLAKGHKLAESDVEVIRFPVKLIPADFQGDIIRDTDKNAALGLELDHDVAAGKILRFSYLAGTGRRIRLGLPQVGYRIVSVKVNKEICTPDLRPGFWVDVRFRRASGLVWVMDRVLVKTINGQAELQVPPPSADVVGLEVRDADASRLVPFLMDNADKVILLTRNPEEPTDTTHKAADGFPGGFNPELEKLTPPTSGGE